MRKLRTWATAGVVGAVGGLISFGWLADIMQHRIGSGGPTELVASADELPWQMFSAERLQELTRQNQTVMVDFTADWCLICKTLERTVLNTDSFSKLQTPTVAA